MKRHQIRRMIPGTISDAQLRRAIFDLGFLPTMTITTATKIPKPS